MGFRVAVLIPCSGPFDRRLPIPERTRPVPAEIRKLARAGASAPPESRVPAISAAPTAILTHFAIYTCQALTARDSGRLHNPRFEVTITSLPFRATSPRE